MKQQKRVPQRGLGVAQLEKIRLEEQLKKEAALQINGGGLLQNRVISPTNSSSGGLGGGGGVQCPSSSSLLRPSNNNSISASSSSAQLPALFPRPISPNTDNNNNNIPSPKSLFRSSPSLSSIPIVEFLGPNSVPYSKPLGGWGATGQGHGNWPRNGDYNIEGGDNLRQMVVDHQQRLSSLASDVVNFGSKSNFPLPRPASNFAQGSQQFQPSSLMNVSTGILPSHLLNYQLEPPSNQNFCGTSSYKPPLWPADEEKVIGMKRAYPFSIETPPAPNFHLKYPPPYGAGVTPNTISRINETAAAAASASSSSASYSNRSAITDLDILRYDREIPTKPSLVFHHREEVKEKQGLNGDFLSLGPPPHHAVGSRHNNSLRYNNKNNYSNVSGHQHQGLFDFAPQPSRGEDEDNLAEARYSKSARTSFFSFLPHSTTAPKKQIDRNAPTDAANNCNGEVGDDDLDLTLKL